MTTVAKSRSPWDGTYFGDGTDLGGPPGLLFDKKPGINDWLLAQGLGMMSAGAPSLDPAASSFLGAVGRGGEKASELVSASTQRDALRSVSGNRRISQLAAMQAMKQQAQADAARREIANRLRAGPWSGLPESPLTGMDPEVAGLLFEAYPEAGWRALLTPQQYKKPDIETFYDGETAVQKAFDPATGTWSEVGRGPRWDPSSGGITPAQEANNQEIDAARAYIATLEATLGKGQTLKEEITRRTSEATATGRDNPDYDPLLSKALSRATNRKIGEDPDYQKFMERVYGTRVHTVPLAENGKPDQAKLKKGDAYMTPQGVLIWNGKGWNRP